MNSTNFVVRVLLFSSVLMAMVAVFNYVVDPYNVFGTNYLGLPKTNESNQLRFSKAIKTRKIKPKSIVLGSSRTEFGYNPDHEFFQQPAYNLAVGGISIAESYRYLQHAYEQKNLKKVLLVADYIMFNSNERYKTTDFETYIDSPNPYKFLLNIKALNSSLSTLYGERAKKYTLYRENGQREHKHNRANLIKFGGQKKLMRRQSTYFRSFDNNNIFRDTGTNSFDDFENFLKFCIENQIELVIIFGPSHALHWESFDYHIGIEKWYEWKTRIVALSEEITSNSGVNPIRIVDFATYNKYTLDSVPPEKNDFMEYHWELNHYKTILGDIVLTDLAADNLQLGVELKSSNIEQHLETQRQRRKENIAIEKYRDEVIIKRKPTDWNSYMLN